MPPPLSSDEDFLRQLLASIDKILTNDFSQLPPQAQDYAKRQVSVAYLNIDRKAKKKRLNRLAFIKRLVNEQILVWLAMHGTASQQASAMSQIMAQNRDAVASYLSPKRFRFHTSDIADEVLSDTFTTFFNGLAHHKPVIALLSTCLIGIARFKALRQLRNERTDPDSQWEWIETTFVAIDEQDIGSLVWPITSNPNSEPTPIDFPIQISGETVTTTPVDPDTFREWLVDCLSQQSTARQLLLRLRYKFWLEQDLKTLTMEEVVAIFNDLDMTDIAKLTGYKNAETANSRLTESRKLLKACLEGKLLNSRSL